MFRVQHHCHLDWRSIFDSLDMEIRYQAQLFVPKGGSSRCLQNIAQRQISSNFRGGRVSSKQGRDGKTRGRHRTAWSGFAFCEQENQIRLGPKSTSKPPFFFLTYVFPMIIEMMLFAFGSCAFAGFLKKHILPISRKCSKRNFKWAFLYWKPNIVSVLDLHQTDSYWRAHETKWISQSEGGPHRSERQR